MRKYLTIVFVLACSAGSYAQSISFKELVNFSNRSNEDVYDYLMDGRVFKEEYIEEVNGQKLDRFKATTPQRAETIVVGKYSKAGNGSILRTVDYTSTERQDIINMIAQAKHAGFQQILFGSDPYNNIYLFDNQFFRITITLGLAKNIGTVQVKQVEYIGEE